MKKTWAVLLIALGLVAGIAAGHLLFAEEQDSQGGGMQDPGMMNQQQQGGPGMMGQGRGMMNGPMKGMMDHMMGGKSSMIATPDGGVIIMEGHRLIKYDGQLTLVKEVELPKGPGPKEGMNKKGSPEGTSSEDAAPQASPIAAAGDSAPQ